MSRFELAPPRHFLLPAILLLLTEHPGYGYALLPRLQEFRFGHVDRPAVYRALSQLERDDLVEASSQHPTAGQARRVYRVTPAGEQALRCWMGVIKEELDGLGEVLRRYQATGSTNAVLAEIEGSWAATLGTGWSAVSPSSGRRRRLVPVEAGNGAPIRPLSDHPPAVRTYRLVPDRSVVLIEVRSSVGPLSFGAMGVSGSIRAAVAGGIVHTEVAPSGRIAISVGSLRSGNGLYDAELLRRIDARRFPTATVDLGTCSPSTLGHRYHVEGAVTFHGVSRAVDGAVNVETVSDDRLLITGEHLLDIRDFAIPSPTVLMLRIYPDVRVRLQAEAEMEEVIQ